MSKFKIGDKVKCIDDSDHLGYKDKDISINLILGKIYTVKCIHRDQIQVQEHMELQWKDNRFRIYKEPIKEPIRKTRKLII